MRVAQEDDVLEALAVEDVPSDRCVVYRAGDAIPTCASPPRSSATFVRLTTLDPALLAGLREWWCTRAHDSRVHATRRLELGAPRCDSSGTWRMSGWLCSPWLRRPIGVDLQLWPRLGAWTKVSMQPQRRLRAGRRYFRMGHRALDALTERLEQELCVTPR
jgi:hypothetical protein